MLSQHVPKWAHVGVSREPFLRKGAKSEMGSKSVQKTDWIAESSQKTEWITENCGLLKAKAKVQTIVETNGS